MCPVVRSPTSAVPSGINTSPVGWLRFVARTPDPTAPPPGDRGEPGAFGSGPCGPLGPCDGAWFGADGGGVASRVIEGCGTQVGASLAPAAHPASSPAEAS